MASNSGIRKNIDEALDLKGKTIEIKVSKHSSRHVHKDLICVSSEYFDWVVEHDEKDENGAFKLPHGDVEEETFDIYIKWHYFDVIFSEKYQDLYWDMRGDIRDREWLRLAELYICGEHMEDRRFRNAVMDAMCEKMTASDAIPDADGYARDLPALAYDSTEKSTPFRKFCAGICAGLGAADWLWDAQFDSEYAKIAFYEDVIVRTFDSRRARSDETEIFPWVNDKCRYHEHGSGEGRCSNESS